MLTRMCVASTGHRCRAAAGLNAGLTKDEALRIAATIAKAAGMLLSAEH
jgi:hypothetical protein